MFREDFEAGNLNQWSVQACPGGVTIVSDRAKDGMHSAQVTVADDDTNAKCASVPTKDTRAQIVSRQLFGNGAEYYIAFSTYFPANFIDPRGWFQIAEFYGPPYGGSPTMGIDLCGLRVCFQRDWSHKNDVIWTMSRDIVRGITWDNFVFRVKFSTDPTVGFVEIWHNGVKQRMANGTFRTTYQTLKPDLNWDGTTPNSLFLNQYRQAGESNGTMTLYHDKVAVGRTYASVTQL